jgi:crotonobetainyl-CoA:carnitine CoA-transferase CaiB-like acyl-CoA transferase
VTDPILDGIRIVDLSWGLAGPVATQILAEAGAEVVKVEPPAGDPLRGLHPAAFASWNRSKRSVVLDLRDSSDHAKLGTLLEHADVLVHGFRPSKASALGLDDGSLGARHPRLVRCALTGYPAGHADAERPGYDLLVQARGGLMDMQAGWRPGPFAWRFPAPSWGAAFLAAAGIVARLIHRERTGYGGAAHTSLVQGLHLIQNMVWNRADKPSVSMHQGEPGTLSSPQVAMYECADGRWLQILNPADRVDLSQLPLMKLALKTSGHAGSVFDGDALKAAMLERPSGAWLEAIRSADVAVELIAPLGDLLSHEEVIANDYAVAVHDPVWGPTRQAGPPFRTSPPSVVRSPAPELGHDSVALDAAPGRPGDAVRLCQSPSAAECPTRPLEGVRVVDFGAFLAGPLATMLLADLGADVIKVEPVTGDPVRGWRDGFFVACNRGKRGVALDLGRSEGGQVRDRLIVWADVVHHNIRRKAAARLGLDEAALRATNPDVVFSHGSAYGLAGARADWPGYDSVFQSMAGWNLANAGEGNPPQFNHLGTLDTLTAASSAVATLLALYHRQRTGQATSTFSSLLNIATFTSSETLVRLDQNALAPYPLLDREQTGLGPGYRIYELRDGWVAVAAPDEVRRSRLREVANVPTDDALAPALRERGSREVLDALGAAGVAAEPVRECHWFSVWDDDENLRTGVVASYDQGDWGQMRQFGAYWHFGDLDIRLDRACPALGQHSHEVLGDLGFGAEEIDRLVDAGVVS